MLFRSASATGVPTGAVSLSDGTGATLGACTLAGGRCTVELALPNGAYELVARYAGDGDFAPSASASLAQVVRAATTTGVVSSADPAAYGQSVTLTVTISTVDGSVATGTVSISEGSTTVGACALASGSCTVTTAALGVGVHLLDVRYGGDAGHAPEIGRAHV